MATWVVLSGKFDALHLSFGVIASAVVTVTSTDLLFPRAGDGRIAVLFRWIAYLPFLTWEILKANWVVLKLVFSPRLHDELDPLIMTFETRLSGDLARMNLANAITLTPGTITCGIRGRTFHVHALTRDLAAGVPGEFEPRLARVFDEKIAPHP